MSLFSKNLRFLRKQRGLSQKQVSLLFNKQGNTVGNWENSKSEPSIGELVSLTTYFKVGLQELLHTDLQEQALHAFDAAMNGSDDAEGRPAAYPVNEGTTSMAQESSDSFWLILRELRAINEKLDAIKQLPESGSRGAGSDKSNH